MPVSQSRWLWPAFIAHRGGGRFAPENTLAAMRAGARMGFGMVEFDVKLSQDGVPFLLHDDTVARTSDGQGCAADLSWKALAGLDFGSGYGAEFAGEPAPTLFSVARSTRALGLCCNVEIKPVTGLETTTGHAVAAAAAQFWQGADLPPLLSSFSEAALIAARAAAPDLPRALLIEGAVPADWPARLQALGCVALHIDARHASSEVLQEAAARQVPVAVWTVNEPAQARALLAAGCTALFTDALDTVRPDTCGTGR